MTRALRERLPVGTSVREPPYSDVMQLTEEERKVLAEKIGGVQNYNPVRAARDGAAGPALPGPADHGDPQRGVPRHRLLRPLRRSRAQEYNVPWHMTLAFARQTFDESRHTHLNMKLLESLGSEVGEYPDIVLGPGRTSPRSRRRSWTRRSCIARINVALEGFALTTFEEIRELAEKIGEDAGRALPRLQHG